jgi:hypothetical protein
MDRGHLARPGADVIAHAGKMPAVRLRGPGLVNGCRPASYCNAPVSGYCRARSQGGAGGPHAPSACFDIAVILVKRRASRLGAAAGLALLVTAGAAKADALALPAISPPLAANPNPFSFTAGPLGTVYVGGMVSGFALAQNNPYAGDINSRWDLSNAQLVVQKTDGLVQFYVQAGQYDVPALATPTVSSSTYTNHAFGFVPQAFLKLAPTDNFSIEVGKLPTLIGDENTFSFQNPNIERGLGWNQTNGQTRGVQANYTIGPVLLNLSWSDGYYSDRFNWISGMATWTIDSANTLGLVGAGNMGKTPASTFITPLFQNNQQIYDLIYTRTQGAWMLQPYVQVSQVPEDRAIGIDSSGSTWTAAFLVNYNIAPNWNLAGRIEYIGTSGGLNLLEGPASNAWSLTVTPTFQYKIYFMRAEASYVAADRATSGDTTFGEFGTKSNQFRALLETGVLF